MKKVFLVMLLFLLTLNSYSKIEGSDAVLASTFGVAGVKCGATYAAVHGASGAVIMSSTAGTTAASLAGTVGMAGTSGAAATSSGFAAIGSTVGGGMAAGAIITTVVPIVVTGVVIYGGFKLYEHSKKNK